ncbi:hypothetical protein [Pedobacter aquatilis]|uniref:hypothetical protein n=1 Tax=Pedobacter aquatilis TaxID=351343 RepID=UPI00292D86A8|nr:hypothetical protein [Pedobacter aquatilis]
MYRENLIIALKNELRGKSGLLLTAADDFKQLVIEIFLFTNDYISPDTLKSFFGFGLPNSNPPLVIMDILSRYAGYHSWKDFVAHTPE